MLAVGEGIHVFIELEAAFVIRCGIIRALVAEELELVAVLQDSGVAAGVLVVVFSKELEGRLEVAPAVVDTPAFVLQYDAGELAACEVGAAGVDAEDVLLAPVVGNLEHVGVVVEQGAAALFLDAVNDWGDVGPLALVVLSPVSVGLHHEGVGGILRGASVVVLAVVLEPVEVVGCMLQVFDNHLVVVHHGSLLRGDLVHLHSRVFQVLIAPERHAVVGAAIAVGNHQMGEATHEVSLTQ